MPGTDKLAEFTAGCAKHLTGGEKGRAQIFLQRHAHCSRPAQEQ